MKSKSPIAVDKVHAKELLSKTKIAIATHRSNLLELINEIEKFFAENKKGITENPRLFKRLKRVYRQAVIQFAQDLENTSKLIIGNLENINLAHLKEVKASPSHQECLNFTNNLALKVAEDLLILGRNIDQRTLAYERWITVLCRQFNRGDYQTANAILSAFSFASVGRLQALSQGLTDKANEIKKAIENLMTKQALLIKNRTKSIVPHLVYYTGHITKLMDRLEEVQTQPGQLNKIHDIKQQVRRYSNEFTAIQENLNEKKSDKRFNIYFYIKMTEQIGSYQVSEKTLYQASLQHEPRERKIPPSNLLFQYPEFSLNHKKRVIVNKKCRVSLEMDQIIKSIENCNSEIKGVLKEIKNYSMQKKGDITKYFRIEAVRFQFKALKKFVENPVNKGSIPDIKKYVTCVNHEIDKITNQKHQSFHFIKTKMNIHTHLVSKLIVLKSYLEKAESLEAKRATLEEENHKIFHEDPVTVVQTNTATHAPQSMMPAHIAPKEMPICETPTAIFKDIKKLILLFDQQKGDGVSPLQDEEDRLLSVSSPSFISVTS